MQFFWRVTPVHSDVKALLILLIIATASTGNLSCQQQSRLAVRRSSVEKSGSKNADSIRFTSFSEASSVIKAFSADLPEGLLHTVAANDESEWNKYVRDKDAEIRKRLHDGDMDTLANLLLFGTSYTSATPLTPELLKTIRAEPVQSAKTGLGSQILLRRLDDLTAGVAKPGTNERLQYFHDLLAGEHYRFETPKDLFSVKQFLGANLIRMLHEDVAYAAALAEAQRMEDKGFHRRSQVFAQRGISLDTSLFPNYAIEEALIRAKQKGLISGRMTKVGVIGPGLDLINKDEGLDFYPEQTIQPFLLADSLVRLGLADPQQLRITTFDISGLVNQHISSICSRAKQGSPYTVQLPIRSDISWTPQAIAYWKHAGTTLGRVAAPLKSSRPAPLNYRAVTFPASQVLRLRPVDLDVIYQKQVAPELEKWDLIIATNMFVYYGDFEQGMAMSNIASMLHDRGLLLTNDALPELPDLELQSLASSETSYSSRAHDGDRITAYQPRRVH